jgi:hypothetical protein
MAKDTKRQSEAVNLRYQKGNQRNRRKTDNIMANDTKRAIRSRKWKKDRQYNGKRYQKANQKKDRQYNGNQKPLMEERQTI